METQAQSSEITSGADAKILVAYFSWSGNAKALAGQIAEAAGGDLFGIKTVTAYPDTYNACIDIAEQERNFLAQRSWDDQVKIGKELARIVI
jgi:flavodoxin